MCMCDRCNLYLIHGQFDTLVCTVWIRSSNVSYSRIVQNGHIAPPRMHIT